MSDLTLIIGNRNYSSWSLRAWLALRRTGQRFEEVLVPLGQPDTRDRILEHSPSGRVPALRHGDLVVWDSLAIGEYLAEAFPEAELWPASAGERAVARAVVAEMHSGFDALRTRMPMNVRRCQPDEERIVVAREDIGRVLALWLGCRRRFGMGGPFLFGTFSLADAFFAPVVTRFQSWGVGLDGEAAEYAGAVWSLPDVQEWVESARGEPWVIPEYGG